MRSKQLVLTLLSTTLLSCASSEGVNAQVSSTKSDELKKIAADTYIYAYPMVVMATTREVMTAVPRPTREQAPINQLATERTLVDLKSTQTYPESDTLTSLSWLDLQEPQVISLPNAGNRFVVFSMISAWGEVFASLGSRVGGNGEKQVLVTGPGWKNPVPAGMQHISAPTNSVWLVGKVQVKGSNDLNRVYAYQDKMRVTSLSRYNSKEPPPNSVNFNVDVDQRTPILDQVANMDARVFFATFASELQRNPPAQTDGAIVSKMAALGIFPNKEFNYDTLPASVKEALNSGYFAGQNQFADYQRGTPNLRITNGWGQPILAGRYDGNYRVRALMTKLGFEKDASQDMAFAQATVDTRGDRLNGSYKYVLKFPKGQTPPVRGFWSVSLYNTRKFYAENPMHRYSLNNTHQLKRNADGSTDIYVQNVSPGKAWESNWLPSPAGEDFSLVMRMYWPEPVILDGKWKIPALEKIPEFKNLSENLN
ncbi:DUF1254 domain-containing protein [Bdellovibrio sp. HCB274]|uniref:DUF1254 domain-containing protein n=1 Tax=Bdellovibrio sp. HCB274 TaxID=3394361 RepID=UPI0039B5B55E